MVAALEADHAFAAGVAAGHAQGQFVGFAAGADQEHDLERSGEIGEQVVGQRDDLAMQIPGIGVQDPALAVDRPGDAPVAVPHVPHVVDGVEVAAARVVVQVGAHSPHHVNRVGVGQTQRRTEKRLAFCR